MLTSHMSLLLLDIMKPEELDDTLVIFSVRDPVARAGMCLFLSWSLCSDLRSLSLASHSVGLQLPEKRH